VANTVLTSSIILKECYAIMHQRSNFIMKTNRQYDNRFAQTGAKIGQTLGIRLPPKFVTRTGNAMSVQNLVERQVALPLATIKGVDLNLTQEELTFSIDRLSENVLQPAISQLSATVEADALSMYKTVPQFAGAVSTAVTYREFQNAGRYMTESLAPVDSRRCMTMNPQTRVDFSDAVKGLFQSSDRIDQQYVEGIMGKTGGFQVYENTIMPAHTPGTFNGTLSTTTSTAADGGYDGTGNAYTTSFGIKFDVTTSYNFNQGDIITIGGVNAVHPETKADYGRPMRFTVLTATSGTTTGTVTVTPAPILSGAYQNVSASIADNATMTVLGSTTGSGTAGRTTYGQNLGFHHDAFAFVTADLEDPSQYGAWGAREVFDGLSMRIWRQGDIANGTFPCRVDICYGYAAIYPEWACRLVHTLA
jgi:hypothetical protein